MTDLWIMCTPLLLFQLVPMSHGKITKTQDMWICDYCAMGMENKNKIFLSNENLMSGPELEPGECGAPILCIFYGLLGTIFLFAIYSNIKGIN